MTKSSRDEFSKETKRILAGRAGHVCSFPGCAQPTSGPSAEADHALTNLGEACHIRAAASGRGARRYDPSMTSAERRSLDNGIWLCRTHGKLIDSDEATYTVEQLHQWRLEAEKRAAQLLRSGSAAALVASRLYAPLVPRRASSWAVKLRFLGWGSCCRTPRPSASPLPSKGCRVSARPRSRCNSSTRWLGIVCFRAAFSGSMQKIRTSHPPGVVSSRMLWVFL